MLQIITEKFYAPGERYETLHRAIFYTNYRVLSRVARMETPVGVLFPTTGLEGFAAFTCEILEKIEKHPDGDKPGVMISTGGDALLNDFAAVVAFALDITCTPDLDLARRLLAIKRPSLGVRSVPSQFVKRTFDSEVISQEGDAIALAQFVTKLVGLERRRFEAAMRSIRQYITGLHRIADNLSLAYAQLIMSIESLSQEVNGNMAEWTDYEHGKRKRIDSALEGASSEIGDRVRNAILENDHVAAARRFRDFALSHVAPSFFRSEAELVSVPIGRADLAVALRQAYTLRSRYVHSLQEIPSQLSVGSMPEMVEEDGLPTLSIAGMSRLARHIIFQFVARGVVVEREAFDYQRSLPNVITVNLASQYWIASTRDFTYRHGPKRLSAFIDQVTSAVLLRAPNANLTDIRPLLELIEGLIPGLHEVRQRLPLLTLYFLFHLYVAPELRCKQWPKLFEKFESDFHSPSIESFVVHLLAGHETGWTLAQYDELFRSYFRTRHRASSTNIGRLLEAAFLICVAETNRMAGNEIRASEMIGLAVEAHPGHAALRSFEASLSSERLPSLHWEQILLQRNL